MRRPAAPIPAWPSTFAADRAEECIVFLAVHALLSDAEKRKVRQRLQKAVDKWNSGLPTKDPNP